MAALGKQHVSLVYYLERKFFYFDLNFDIIQFIFHKKWNYVLQVYFILITTLILTWMPYGIIEFGNH